MNNYQERYKSIKREIEENEQKIKSLEEELQKKDEEYEKLYNKSNEEFMSCRQLESNMNKIITSKDKFINTTVNILWILFIIGTAFISSNISSSISTSSGISDIVLKAATWIAYGSISSISILFVAPLKKTIMVKIQDKIRKENSECQSLSKKIDKKNEQYNDTKTKIGVLDNEVDTIRENIEKLKELLQLDIKTLEELEKEIINYVIAPTKVYEYQSVEPSKPYTRKREKKNS